MTLVLDDRTLTDARDAILSEGWWRWPSALSPVECDALLDRGGTDWRPLVEQVGPVRQHGWYCQPPIEQLPTQVRAFADRLAHDLGIVFGSIPLPARFNEITWQRHLPGAEAVSAHRDQPHYLGVIAILTLVGSARFTVLAERNPRKERCHWTASAGDLVLLRAGGLDGTRVGCPWHEVGAPDHGERITLTLRHSSQPPGGWE